MKKLLKSIRACAEANIWVGEKTRSEAWSTCERADWMLWLLEKMAGSPGWPDAKLFRLCACDCAETALKYVPESETSPRVAIETARSWCRGEATDEQLAAAWDAARTTAWDAARTTAWAAAGDAAWAAAWAAARAAAWAAAGDAARAAAWAAAGDAVWAAAGDAAWAAAWDAAGAAAGAAARAAALKQMADLIRQRVPTIPEVEMGNVWVRPKIKTRKRVKK